MMAVRRRLIAQAQHGDVLPSAYTRVKCIVKGPDPRQYIDTGITLRPGLYLKKFDYRIDSFGYSANPIFGSRNISSTNAKFVIWLSGSLYPAINYGPYDSGYKYVNNGSGRHTIQTTPYPNVSMSFDGNVLASTTPTADIQASNLKLFICNMSTADSTGHDARSNEMKIYGVCIAGPNGDLFRAVPVVRNQDDVAGLYDFVSKSFIGANYGNFSYESLSQV